MKVLVCGGRDFDNTKFIWDTLNEFHRVNTITQLIEGNAKGADRIAGFWARHRGIENRKFPANWKKHNVAAGPIRNQQMLDEGKPDYVIAFPGKKGTMDMVRRARLACVPVLEVGGK